MSAVVVDHGSLSVEAYFTAFQVVVYVVEVYYNISYCVFLFLWFLGFYFDFRFDLGCLTEEIKQLPGIIFIFLFLLFHAKFDWGFVAVYTEVTIQGPFFLWTFLED